MSDPVPASTPPPARPWTVTLTSIGLATALSYFVNVVVLLILIGLLIHHFCHKGHGRHHGHHGGPALTCPRGEDGGRGFGPGFRHHGGFGEFRGRDGFDGPRGFEGERDDFPHRERGGDKLERFGGGDPAQAADRILDHLGRVLNLTDAQKTQLKPILQAQADQIKKQADETRKTFEQLKTDTQAKIRAVLTPDQQKTFDQLPKPGERKEGGHGPHDEEATPAPAK